MSAAALPECSGGNGVLAFIGCYVTHDDVIMVAPCVAGCHTMPTFFLEIMQKFIYNVIDNEKRKSELHKLFYHVALRHTSRRPINYKLVS